MALDLQRLLPGLALGCAASLLFGGCTRGVFGDHSVFNFSGNRMTLSILENGQRRAAELERIEGADRPGGGDLWRVVTLSPEDDLGWLFSRMDGDSVLVTADGREIPHPDRAVVVGLLRDLDSGAVSAPVAFEAARSLLRNDSRERVFRAALQRAETPADLAPLLRGLSTALLAPRPNGEDPGGSRGTMLTNCGKALAVSPLLDRVTADEVAALAEEAGSSSRAKELLLALVPKASVPAVVAATAEVGSSSARCELLLALLAKPGLGLAEADAVVAASPQLGSSSKQAEVLQAAVGKATAPAILAAAREVSSSSAQRDVLLALLPLGEVAPLLAAVQDVSSSSARQELLLALAQRPGLAADDADLMVQAAAQLTSSSDRHAELLMALLPSASRDALVTSAAQISSSSARARAMEAIARRK